MGYNTDFCGKFKLNKKLTPKRVKEINDFSEADHEYDYGKADKGIEQEFPGNTCQWIASEKGKCIQWDGNEKFYQPEEWLRYIIKKFLAPYGYVLNGEVWFRGEEFDDAGTIVVRKNHIVTVMNMSFEEFPKEMIVLLAAEEDDEEARECLKIAAKEKRE